MGSRRLFASKSDQGSSSERKAPENSSNETEISVAERVRLERQDIIRGKNNSIVRLVDIWAAPSVKIARFFERNFRVKIPENEREAQSWTSGAVAKEVLNVLQTYVLPPLYGWLGAIAYVLRRLISEIAARTYDEDNNISYTMRIYLGILAGLAVGWFFSSTALPGPDVLRVLSPLALAFLAGYSVELLFSAMDKLLEAFSRSDGSKPSKA